MEDRFEWLPTECADERYPMQLISGQLDCGDSIVEVPAGKIVNNGWGEVGSRRLVGDPQKPVPERLSLAWFSYTEDQFFAGAVALPHAELTELFRAGVRDPLTGELLPWSKVIVGMGLGGWTSVWLAADALVREVATATLEPTQLDWARVLDNPDIARADFIRATLRRRLSDAELRAWAERGPPVASWPRHARRCRWRILVEGLQVPLDMTLRFCNGERTRYDFAKTPPGELTAAPRLLQITWRTRSGRKLLTRIRLDDDELFAAFEAAGAFDPETATARLRVEIGLRGQVTITVERDAQRIPLTRASVELLSIAE